MAWWQNIPLFQIVLPLMCAALCSALREKAARRLSALLAALECASMGVLTYYTAGTGESFVYAMGEIGAPFGNELRVGPAEALTGLMFALVMFLSILGGWRRLTADVAPNRRSLYAAVTCLIMAAMAAMVFTNDLFTGYVFIEISTIAACALILASNQGRTLFSAARYMVMNLMGSGLFLLGLSILYCLTGHLLFPQLGESVRALLAQDRYPVPLYLSFLLLTLGVAIKSALYPFHTWLPDAYGKATATSSAILSSLISKIYIFLLIKIFVRAAGADVFALRIGDVLFLCAGAGMVMGSVHAIRQRRLCRMVAYSSVAQIGYIFLGVSLGTQAGVCAAVYHMLAHSAAKSMLFLSAHKLRDASGGEDTFPALRGSAKRAPLAALAFAVGACALVGVPGLGCFVSKVFLARAGVETGGWRMAALLFFLAVSTALNVAYMLRTALTLYRAGENDDAAPREKDGLFAFAAAALILINIALGLLGGPVMELINQGMLAFR